MGNQDVTECIINSQESDDHWHFILKFISGIAVFINYTHAEFVTQKKPNMSSIGMPHSSVSVYIRLVCHTPL